MPARKKSIGGGSDDGLGDTTAGGAASALADADASYSGKQGVEMETLGIDNFELPKSVVGKLAKSVMPANIQLRKDVQTALIKCGTVFINYLSAAAQDRSNDNGRKTVSGQDVLLAAQEIDMPEEMFEALTKHLQAYQKLQKTKRSAAKDKAAEKDDAGGAGDDGEAGEGGDEEAPKKKKRGRKPKAAAAAADADADAEAGAGDAADAPEGQAAAAADAREDSMQLYAEDAPLAGEDRRSEDRGTDADMVEGEV